MSGRGFEKGMPFEKRRRPPVYGRGGWFAGDCKTHIWTQMQGGRPRRHQGWVHFINFKDAELEEPHNKTALQKIESNQHKTALKPVEARRQAVSSHKSITFHIKTIFPKGGHYV